MNKKNVITVLAYLVACGLLVAALSTWLGPQSNSAKVETNIEAYDNEAADSEPFVAPLNLEELKAYSETMTNKSNPVAEVKTNKGTFQLELFEDTMPITAGNFIELAEAGYYDGILFHRIIPNFMIQGGDPLTKEADTGRYGTGGPGYAIPDEHTPGEHLTNVRGSISMANSGPNSGGSQFFINVADNTNLDFDKQPLSSKHPVFGKIVSGMEIIDAIAAVERDVRDLPIEPIVMEKVTIVR